MHETSLIKKSKNLLLIHFELHKIIGNKLLGQIWIVKAAEIIP